MSAGRICTRSTDTVEPTETVQTAACRMLDRNVGSLVVVNQHHEPIGILTDRDLALRIVATAKDVQTTFVKEIMTPNLQVVSETTPIEDVVRVMRSGPYRRVPVVDSNGRLAGMVTLDDVLDLLSEEFNSIGRLLRKESPAAMEMSR